MSRRHEKLDCRTCGACCVSFYEQECYCDLRPDDISRLSKKFVKEHVNLDLENSSITTLVRVLNCPNVYGAIRTKWSYMRSGPLKGLKVNTCRALRGSVMSRVSCSIYKNRPSICREAVTPGSRGCLEVRRAFKNIVDEIKAG